MSNSTSDPSAADGTLVDLGTIMDDVSFELATLSEKCTLLQWSLSSLLDQVHHPDLGAEIHMLQDVDRIQQTLNDIASILAVTRSAANGIPCHRDQIGKAIRLESLRQRLGLSRAPTDPDLTPDDTGITWF